MAIVSLFLDAPWWVWPLFCYLMFVGYSTTKPRKMMILLFFILPLIFMAMKVEVVLKAEGMIQMLFVFSLFIGFLFGVLVTMCEKISFDRKSYEVLVPGNWYTFFLLLFIFSVKFASGAAQAVKYEHYFTLYLVETGVHVFISGFFLGKASSYVSRFFLNIE